ncbi:hypothetical protein D3C86_1380590 [compost metagenome]
MVDGYPRDARVQADDERAERQRCAGPDDVQQPRVARILHFLLAPVVEKVDDQRRRRVGEEHGPVADAQRQEREEQGGEQRQLGDLGDAIAVQPARSHPGAVGEFREVVRQLDQEDQTGYRGIAVGGQQDDQVVGAQQQQARMLGAPVATEGVLPLPVGGDRVPDPEGGQDGCRGEQRQVIGVLAGGLDGDQPGQQHQHRPLRQGIGDRSADVEECFPLQTHAVCLFSGWVARRKFTYQGIALSMPARMSNWGA